MTQPNGESNTATTSTDDPEGVAALGDAGKRALDVMKAERNDAKAKLAAALAEVERLKPKPEPATPAAATADSAPDVASIVKSATDQLRAESLLEKAADKLEAKAAALLHDAGDATRHLKASQFVKDGVVDLAAMDDALKALVEGKPYLAKDSKPKFEGGADGGAKPDIPGKQQWSQADLDRQAALGVPGALAIEKARVAGNLDNLLGIKR